MNRRSFVASLAALPALLFGRKATATPLHGPVEQPDFQLLAFHAPPEWRAEVQPKAVPEDASTPLATVPCAASAGSGFVPGNAT
jgi:hypothetical protein